MTDTSLNPTRQHANERIQRVAGPVEPRVTLGSPLARLAPLDHHAVQLDDTGWVGEWQRRTLTVTLPHVLTQLEAGEATANLRRLTGQVSDGHHGMVFTDTDVHKTLEAIAWAAHLLPQDHELLRRAERLVELLSAAQESDGYLNSYVQGSSDVDRWSDPQWGHELYTAGHLFQAAVAAARTGVLPELVTVALRFATLLVNRFPPGDEYVEGHPEVETALVELFRVTGDRNLLGLARQQLDARGHGWLGEDKFGANYFQDAVPLREATVTTGHAVRQLYLLTGAVDLAVEDGDVELLAAVERLWEDLADRRTYVSGAVGSRHRDEAIGDAYELPADRAYAESCAAIASLQLNWRLLLATGSVRYADAMEQVLYNAVAASTALSGTEFFYSNPLHLRPDHDGSHEDAPTSRLPWYACACCPPNIARLLTSAHDYLATESTTGLAIHLYAASEIQHSVSGVPVQVRVTTSYPWTGSIDLEVSTQSADPWELALRVPAWCHDWQLTVAGEKAFATAEDGYVRIRRSWQGWTSLRLDLQMPVRAIEAHPRVDAVRGCVALARGPVLYCLEQADLPADTDVDDLQLVAVREVAWSAPGAVAPVTVRAAFQPTPSCHSLYRERSLPGEDVPGQDDAKTPLTGLRTVSLIPYHRWANRGAGAMRVWLPLADPKR